MENNKMEGKGGKLERYLVSIKMAKLSSARRQPYNKGDREEEEA